jgi:hypothetical protein
LDLGASIEATPQAAQRMQPRDRPLNEPAEFPQAAAMFRVPLAQHRRDPQPAQQGPQRLRVMHEANLDEGALWPTAFALEELTAAEKARIAALMKKAVS